MGNQWIQALQCRFSSFAIGDSLYIHPEWEKLSPDFLVPILVEFGEAFGTGTWNGMTASNWTSIIYAGIHDTTTASIHNGEGGADIQNSIGSDFANGSYIRGTITYTTN